MGSRANAVEGIGLAVRGKKRVRGSTTGRPVMVLLDLLGKRWTMRILWELRGGARTFRSLQEVMDGVSPSVLNTRLRELRAADLVERIDGEGYALTKGAIELSDHLMPLDAWARKWARRNR